VTDCFAKDDKSSLTVKIQKVPITVRLPAPTHNERQTNVGLGLKGCFPIGLPVLIHDQLAHNDLETHIALVTKCLDPLRLSEVYYGRIQAVCVTGGRQLYLIDKLEHYRHRRSACYLVYLCEAEMMMADFSQNWNSEEIKQRIEWLMAAVT
jgi:hypothetical protein